MNAIPMPCVVPSGQIVPTGALALTAATTIPVQYIISGGQIGADEGALAGAAAVGIPTKGAMPVGFIRATGPDPDFAARYGLVETHYPGGGNAARDRENVDSADLVIAFLSSQPKTGRGTCSTLAYALGRKKADKEALMRQCSGTLVGGIRTDVILFVDTTEDNVEAVSKVLIKEVDPLRHKRVMVSGPLESTMPGITRTVAAIVQTTFSRCS